MPNEEYQKLGWKTFWVFLSDKSKIAVLIGFIALAFVVFKVPYAGWVALVFFLAMIITAIVTWIDYVGYGYQLGPDALKLRRGTFNKEEVAIPYRQIQNVDIERPFLYVLSGTSKIVILTAGHEDADAKENGSKGESEGIIPIIDSKLAVSLQNELLSRANIQKVIQA
ncbi:MAG: PH domain-containing protein [Minisyncoccia bacterium]